MLQETIEEIKKNVLFVLDDVLSSRQYLNKHFQNSMNNYFLENYATLPCLKKRFETQSGRQVRKDIFEKYTSIAKTQESTLKCFLIMRGFVEEHILNNSLEEYRASLSSIASTNSADSLNQGSAEWISLQWRRLFALMVLHHSYYSQIQGVYDLWAHIFGEKIISKERQKKRKFRPLVPQNMAPYVLQNREVYEKKEEEEQEELEQQEEVEEERQNGLSIKDEGERRQNGLSIKDEGERKSIELSIKDGDERKQIELHIKDRDERKQIEFRIKDEEELQICKKRKTQDTIILGRDPSSSFSSNLGSQCTLSQQQIFDTQTLPSDNDQLSSKPIQQDNCVHTQINEPDLQIQYQSQQDGPLFQQHSFNQDQYNTLTYRMPGNEYTYQEYNHDLSFNQDSYAQMQHREQERNGQMMNYSSNNPRYFPATNQFCYYQYPSFERFYTDSQYLQNYTNQLPSYYSYDSINHNNIQSQPYSDVSLPPQCYPQISIQNQYLSVNPSSEGQQVQYKHDSKEQNSSTPLFITKQKQQRKFLYIDPSQDLFLALKNENI